MRHRVSFAFRLATLVMLLFFHAAFLTSAFAATSSGIDTVTGVHSLPLAVEGVAGLTLSDSGAPSGTVYVGIGTTNPLSVLDVNGTTAITGGSGTTSGLNGIHMFFNGTAGTITATDSGVANRDLTIQGLDIALQANGTTAEYIQNGGNVGIGMTPSYPLDVNGTVRAVSTNGWWSGCFGSDCGGGSTQYGVYGNGSSDGVYGRGNGSGNGVFGASDSGWAGNFQGGSGVFGQSSSGWAGQFNSQDSQNGVYIDNNAHNAQLCLNGTDSAHCMTTFPTHLFGGIFTYSNSTPNHPSDECWGNPFASSQGAVGAVNTATPYYTPPGNIGGCGCPSWAPNVIAITPTNVWWGIVWYGNQSYSGYTNTLIMYACYSD